ncbi:hypothetical protein ACKLNR_003536 [Fusarium oxysporum f. sp. zingiberi]
MEQHTKIVMAPRKPDSDDKNTSIFLAGITTSTDEPDWRETLTKALMNQHVTILNPNRPDWDSTWKEDFSDKRWEEQVWWELDMQEAADIIVFFFHPSTEAPISLMELGLAVKTKPERSIVCALDGYRKKGNVEAVCKRPDSTLRRKHHRPNSSSVLTSDHEIIGDSWEFSVRLNDHVRDLVEEAKCLERDGNSCVMLGTVDPMVSHIIPYTWWDTKEHGNTTGDIKFRGPSLLSVNLLGGNYYVYNQHELRGTDKLWNMICLHPDLHELWARGYCGFKSGKPLPSGYLIHINMQTDETKRFKEVIDIQWACILFAAFSGAAGNPELPSRQNPDDKAMQWIQSQAR